MVILPDGRLSTRCGPSIMLNAGVRRRGSGHPFAGRSQRQHQISAIELR